jgi:hypothetical protein
MRVSMFVYGLGDKTAGGQQSWSMVLIGIVGAISGGYCDVGAL